MDNKEILVTLYLLLKEENIIMNKYTLISLIILPYHVYFKRTPKKESFV